MLNAGDGIIRIYRNQLAFQCPVHEYDDARPAGPLVCLDVSALLRGALDDDRHIFVGWRRQMRPLLFRHRPYLVAFQNGGAIRIDRNKNARRRRGITAPD